MPENITRAAVLAALRAYKARCVARGELVKAQAVERCIQIVATLKS